MKTMKTSELIRRFKEADIIMDYIIIILTHALLSVPFWFICPRFNFVLLFIMVFNLIFISTKEGRKFFNSQETNQYYE